MAAASSKTKSKTTAKKASKPVEVEPTVEEGTWQETIFKSHKLLQRGTKATAQAGGMLWAGAQEGIIDWLDDKASDDVNAEGLYNEIVALLGSKRRGDAHKIKQVALAARDHGLTLASYPSLNKAGIEAKRLLVTVKQNEDEDNAADEAVQAIAEAAPKSTSKPEGAAQILLKDGIDEAARLLLDALNGGVEKDGEPVQNVAAHRALLRAISQEIGGRAPKPEPKPKAEAKPKATAKAGAGKGKARPKPNPKVSIDEANEAAQKFIDEQAVEAPEDSADIDDMFDEVEADAGNDDEGYEPEAVEPEPTPVKAKAKPKPVVRRA